MGWSLSLMGRTLSIHCSNNLSEKSRQTDEANATIKQLEQSIENLETDLLVRLSLGSLYYSRSPNTAVLGTGEIPADSGISKRRYWEGV